MESFSNIVKDYWEETKNLHDISYEEFKKICYAPFEMVRDVMSSGVLKDIRFKFLGIFKVSESRVKYSKKSLKDNLDKGVISQKRYEDKIKVLGNYDRSN